MPWKFYLLFAFPRSLSLLLSLGFLIAANTAYAGTTITAAPNPVTYGTSANPTLTCDAAYPRGWTFFRVDTGAHVGSDFESDLTGGGCSTDVTTALSSSLDSLFGSAGGTIRALYINSNNVGSDCFAGSTITSCEAQTGFTGEGSHTYDIVLTGSGGGGGGSGGTYLQWLISFMVVCIMFVFLIAIAPRFEEFLSELSPARFLSSMWGRRKLRKKLWK